MIPVLQKSAAIPEDSGKCRQALPFRVLGHIGRWTISSIRPLIALVSTITAVLWQSCRPLNWRRTLIREFLRQCYFVGFRALPVIAFIAMLTGLAMVFQFLYWLGLAGKSNIVGEIIVLIMVREIAPLLVALIVVGRSGSVNMVEMGHMRVSGQLHILDAQGIDPFLFFLVPRCLATAISMFCLTVLFILIAVITGYLVGSGMGASDMTIFEFVNKVLAAMGAGDYAIIALKPTFAGMVVAAITCTTGLSVDGLNRRLAQALPLGFIKSALAVLLISGILSVLL